MIDELLRRSIGSLTGRRRRTAAPASMQFEALTKLKAAGLPVPDMIGLTPGEITRQGMKAIQQLTSTELDGLPLFAIRADGAKLYRSLLNVGLSEETVDQLAREIGDSTAYMLYARFIADFAELAYGQDPTPFADLLDDFKDQRGVLRDADLDAHDWRRLAERFAELLDEPLPTSTLRQVMLVRDKHGADGPLLLQRMVSPLATDWKGRVISRDVTTGKAFNGVTPPPVDETLTALARQSEGILEAPSELAISVVEGAPWILDVRHMALSNAARLTATVEMVSDGSLTPQQGVAKIDPASLDEFLHPRLDPSASYDLIAKGLPASPGAVSGQIMFDAKRAERAAAKGEAVILVRTETTPDEVYAIKAAVGIVTSRGGAASHAAAVARGMGRPCVVGVSDFRVNDGKRRIYVRDQELLEGDVITIDGASGMILRGKVPTIDPSLSGDLAAVLSWADSIRRLKVYANADEPDEARAAAEFGAEGIGLTRTEHMFFQDERLVLMRVMILARTPETRREALDAILPLQRDDFIQMFRTMAGKPVTIRLLDPPLHEFLPRQDREFEPVAEALGLTLERVKARAARLEEANPMLGHRGCRLGLTSPAIYEMQVEAIIEAARVVHAEGIDVRPEIMIPLVAWPEELRRLRRRLDGMITRAGLPIRVGTMIELPRAALMAGEIAKLSDFFSFGTNDLTQTTFGISRDDAAWFLKSYEQDGLIDSDPFRSLDQNGVGELITIAVERGRAVAPDLVLGICGEHGGDPQSILFCERIGLDYVSCSPYRVPIARLAAARATLVLQDEGALAAAGARGIGETV